jgi:hypothetical protein
VVRRGRREAARQGVLRTWGRRSRKTAWREPGDHPNANWANQDEAHFWRRVLRALAAYLAWIDSRRSKRSQRQVNGASNGSMHGSDVFAGGKGTEGHRVSSTVQRRSSLDAEVLCFRTEEGKNLLYRLTAIVTIRW